MFAAKLVRTFYGQQCFAVFNRIQEEGHARDDALSLALRLEIKDVRRIVDDMKVVISCYLVLSIRSIRLLVL